MNLIIYNLLIFFGGIITFFTWHTRENEDFQHRLGWLSLIPVLIFGLIHPLFSNTSDYIYLLLTIASIASAIIVCFLFKTFERVWIVSVLASLYPLVIVTNLVTLPIMTLRIIAASLLTTLIILMLLVVKHKRKLPWTIILVLELVFIAIPLLEPYTVAGYALLLIFFTEWIINEYRRYNALRSDQELELQALKEDYQYSVANETLRRTALLEQSIENIKERSLYDPLTKAYNRDGLAQIYKKLVASKQSQPFSILLFDIDNFKGINDRLGHNVGDECLKRLAYLVRISKRDQDHLIRLGGDEFLVVLPNLNTADALKVGERFVTAIRTNTQPQFTVSMGVSTYPSNGLTLEAIIEAADKGLYVAKERGKNQIAYAPE